MSDTNTAGGTKTVLVVEDESVLLELMINMLERLGYQAIGANTGMKAIELLRSRNPRLDLALLDARLPDMGGLEVLRTISRTHPEVKTIACSGYSLDRPVNEMLEAGACGFLQKPFSLDKLESVLDAVSSALPASYDEPSQ